MKHCNSCNVLIDSPVAHCPLCYTTLTSVDKSGEVAYYPNLDESIGAYNLLIRILAFISVSIVAVCITINLLTPINFPWSLIVTICTVYIWVALGTVVSRNNKVGFNLLVQLLSLGAFLMVLGAIFGFKTSVYNYVFPALVSSAMLSFNILSIVKRKEIQQFLIYYLIVGFLGFLPLILIFNQRITVIWPAVACAVYCGLSIVSVFIFAFRATKTELKKRFNI